MPGYLSLLLRRKRAQKEKYEITRKYEAWKQEIHALPKLQENERKILIIRLDDIGDYILFRNCLAGYQYFFSKQDYKVYLLGNDAWKPVFDQYDATGIQPLWLDKKRYWQDGAYRLVTWENLRKEGFDMVICPSRTRPLLLDDLCTLACAPSRSLAAANTHVHAEWNNTSDSIYTDISRLSLLPDHEFIFNAKFAAYICPASRLASPKLHITTTIRPTELQPYILCFVGASAKSKLWPATRWIKLLHLIQKHFSGTIFIGGGPAEKELAGVIANATGCIPIAGAKTLTEMITLIAHSEVTISNDTMAAHIGAASGTNTIIVTTGNNSYRFTDYSKIGLKNVVTVYAPRYQKLLKKGKQKVLSKFQGVTSDIAAIHEQEVFSALQQFIGSLK